MVFSSYFYEVCVAELANVERKKSPSFLLHSPDGNIAAIINNDVRYRVHIKFPEYRSQTSSNEATQLNVSLWAILKSHQVKFTGGEQGTVFDSAIFWAR